MNILFLLLVFVAGGFLMPPILGAIGVGKRG